MLFDRIENILFFGTFHVRIYSIRVSSVIKAINSFCVGEYSYAHNTAR